MSSRPLVIALAASAAVNVFLIGGLAGMAFIRLTTPTPAPVVSAPAAPKPAVVANPPPAAASPTPVAPVSETPRPTRHAVLPAPPQQQPAMAAPPPPPPVVAPPAPLVAAPRPPLISAGDGLSPDSRKAFRRALNEANKRNRPLTEQARAERQAALSALSAPGYDAGEVTRRWTSARALDQQARGNVEAALAAFTATLSPQERAILADGLAQVYAPPPAAPKRMEGPN